MAKRVKSPIVPRQRPRVLLSVTHGSALDAIIQQARVFDWDLLDLDLTGGAVLKDIPPSGALVNKLPTAPLVKSLRKLGIPVVRIGHMPHPQDPLVPAVLPDQVAAGRLAADHFVARGFEHLAHVGHLPWSLAKPMHEGFVARILELGLPPPELFRVAPGEQAISIAAKTSRFKRRTHVMLDWLQSLPKPVGILLYNDLRAASLCVMCHEAGINVPDELALLGCGNNERTCEVSPVALSSIDPARDVLGRQAACLLHDLMAGGALPSAPILVPPRGIVARRSTEVLAVGDPLVARAMRFIWDHYGQDVSVNDVTQQVGVPRHQLERAFRKHRNGGINEELTRKRLEEFTRRLGETDDTITDLALLCGFRTMANLHKAFKATYGVSPRDYRTRQRTSGS